MPEFTYEYHATGRVTVEAETESEAYYEARAQAWTDIDMGLCDFSMVEVK